MSGKADGESVLAGLLGDADAEREVIAAVVGAGVETRINPAKMAATKSATTVANTQHR
jgi:hypothetical protein